MALDLTTIEKKYLSARNANQGNNILSPICRISYPHLFTPKPMGKNNDPNAKKKFSVSLLIPPNCDIALLRKAASQVAQGTWGEKVKEMKIKSPFLKAEDFKYEGYLPGWTLLRPTSDVKPRIRIIEEGTYVAIEEEDSDEVYPGRWATVSLNAYSYDFNGNKGVSFGLNNVVLLNHDDSLSGRAKPEDEFDAPSGVSSPGAEKTGTIDDMF